MPTQKDDLLIVGRGTDLHKATRGEIAPRGMSAFCSGVPGASEVVAGAEARYGFTIVPANCTAEASVAATGSTTFIIKKNGTQVGTIVFAAAATLGSVNITDTAVALGDRITIEAPATADATLATLTFLLSE